MLDLKTLNSALEQLETERGIPKERIIEAVEDALAAAYKKDYGKRGQIIRAKFDLHTGKTDFFQIKTVVDETTVRIADDETPESEANGHESKTNKSDSKTHGLKTNKNAADSNKDSSSFDVHSSEDTEEKMPRYNPEHHILLEDARKIKKDAQLDEEIVFPLEAKDDYGRIAAQTAKQVIIQRIREAERVSVTEEFEKREGDIVSGVVQRIERGNTYVDLGRVTGIIPYEEQIPGERFRPGERIQAYLYAVEETARDISLRLSRSHPQFLHKLFEREVPEVANGVVEIKQIAREPGSRAKIAVSTNDEHIDPVGSCVGGRGVRVSTVMSELGGEKIDIIEWSPDPSVFIERALSPAHVVLVTLNGKGGRASVEVAPDQYSLAIGRGGQNVRLAAKLTGWKLDIREAGSNKEATGVTATSDDEQESGEKPEA